jgi:predicted type IV restriction endonuclease
MKLERDFAKLLEGLGQEPENEADTGFRVIEPVLLEVLGYGRNEIVREQTAQAGNRPDYTVLPGAPQTWLLEAKAWSVELTDQHALQATTYAYQNGCRWVVLTNGREWRLYDSHVTGANVADRLVLAATRGDAAVMAVLLEALHRSTVVQERLPEVVGRRVLVEYLRSELVNPTSECIRALRSVARRQTRLEQVTAEAICEALRAVLSPATQPDTQQTPSSVPPEAAGTSVSGDVPSVEGVGEAGVPPTDEVPVTDPVFYRRTANRPPRALILPDGTKEAVQDWREVLVALVTWLANHAPKPIPIPWSLPKRSGAYWINTEPLASPGVPMNKPRRIEARGAVFYLQTHNFSGIAARAAREICQAVGVDPSTVRVVVR